MADSTLDFSVRTPHHVVLQVRAHSLRVLTETGHVGLRPRAESTVLAVEAGIVSVRTEAGMQYVGTAGGLLLCDGVEATLLTPLAVVGTELSAITSDLETALLQPDTEMQARSTLSKLEGKILSELRHEQQARVGLEIES